MNNLRVRVDVLEQNLYKTYYMIFGVFPLKEEIKVS